MGPTTTRPKKPLSAKALRVKTAYRPDPAAVPPTPPGWGDNTRLPPAPSPTDALPGTEEKMAVMAWRAENGYAVFHPGDPVLFADVDGIALRYLRSSGRRSRLGIPGGFR